MSIDGPGATESPYTVDAGHFQIEMTLFGYSSYQQTFDGVDYRLDVWNIGPINLKAGLLNRLDLQLLLEPYVHVFEREDGLFRSTRHGFGDTTVRLKYNLWGNDSGRTALAVMPFVTFPTGDEGVGRTNYAAGLTVPFAAKLPWDFHLGLTTRFETDENELVTGRHVEFINSIALAHEIVRDLDGYVEFFSDVSTEEDVGWVGTFNTGLGYWLSDDLQVNAGVDIGLTTWADDWYAFVGMAWRY
jgi:hypothetical protein